MLNDAAPTAAAQRHLNGL